LVRCVEALFKVETTETWELIIVNNGSQDGTGEFLRSLPSSYNNIVIVSVFESRPGLGIARNAGWRRARGELVAFTDDDCYVASDYASNVVRVFREDEGLSFIGGRVLLFDPSDVRMAVLEVADHVGFDAYRFIPPGAVAGANMAFRKQVLERIGGFDENFGPGTRFVCDDIDAVAAALWAGLRGAYDPRPTVYHHHRRRTAEEAEALSRIYRRGRGAYYAKYILKKESRSEYLWVWMRTVKHELRDAVAALFRGKRPHVEAPVLCSAAQYAASRFRRQCCGCLPSGRRLRRSHPQGG
jgi:glycosyltransferase involved in cell wall biosynthesis